VTLMEKANLRVVLVDDAPADGSSWSEVTKLLHRAGVTVTLAQNPVTSLADDVAQTRHVLAQQPGPVILAGHSFGGTVISEAGADPKVAALVYVAASAPDVGEDYVQLAESFPASPDSDSGDFAQARTTVAAWRSRPTWYAVSEPDRTIAPDLQRFMAERMGAMTIEIDAAHQAQDVAQLIVDAVDAVRSSDAPDVTNLPTL